MTKKTLILIGIVVFAVGLYITKEVLIPAFVVTKTVNPTRVLGKARDAQRAHDLSQLKIDLGAYEAQYQKYPAELSQMVASGDSLRIPFDPDAGTPYEYVVSEDFLNYSLCAIFADGNKKCVGPNTSL